MYRPNAETITNPSTTLLSNQPEANMNVAKPITNLDRVMISDKMSPSQSPRSFANTVSTLSIPLEISSRPIV